MSFIAFAANTRIMGYIVALVLMCMHTVTAQDEIQHNEYRISSGDAIDIKVYGESELSLANIPIPSNGVINYPFLGKIKAKGYTEIELASIIATQLTQGFLLDPQVTVIITSYRPIYIGGAIKSPGQKSYFVTMDAEKLIEVSGGFATDADRESITLLRESATGDPVEQKIQLDFKVQPGDILTIGRLAKELVEAKEYIYLYGEVGRPGRYEYLTGLSVEKAIIIAGGFGNRASKRKISVSRGTPAVKKKKVPLDYPVLPGDVITIGASWF